MKNLRVWQKLGVLGVLFLVPFLLVTWKLISNVNELGIDFARLEIRGVQHINPLLTLLRQFQEERGIAHLALTKGGAHKEELQRKISDVEAAIKGVDDADQQHGPTLKTTDAWRTLKGELQTFLSKVASSSASDSYLNHSVLITKLIQFITLVGDNSKLTLDPDLDSYYLMSILQFEAPKLAERLAEARGTGGLMLAEQKQDRSRLLPELHRNVILSQYLQQGLDSSFDKAFTANGTLRTKLEASQRGNRTTVAKSLETVQTLHSNPESDMDPAEYFTTVNKGLESIYRMEASVSDELRHLLDVRIANMQGEVRKTLLWAAAGLFAVLVIGFFIMRDVTRPLGEVVAVADQIALGNISATTTIADRGDEIGDLSKSFNKMTVALREMSRVVEQIAAGNLAVNVKPQSQQDVMGNALASMVQQLSSLTGQVQKSGTQVTTSIQDIAATSKEQQATASEIAATTTEIGATSKEISATSKELVRTMTEVASVAEETAQLAGNSQDALTRMETTMRHITEAAGSINAKLSVLNEKAGNINQVVTTITKVADQTNLLSLNAAIEAEKAGEYGRGFSVVATEIRRLADQTAVATYDIEQIVKEMQSAVSAGVMGMDKFSEEVRRGVSDVQQVSTQVVQIIQQVQALTPRFESVSEGMQSQSTGAQQISEALFQLTESAQQTVESLRLSNQTIDQLRDAASGMQNGISRFKL